MKLKKYNGGDKIYLIIEIIFGLNGDLPYFKNNLKTQGVKD
jgi:hypothetical protein